ncbi:MAG TPA: ribosome silencing factor [Vicinamibacterales bacterium]|nr:ribosome silencing factor [Vicinamibacterales bacterium]
MTTRENRSATTADGLPSPVERAIEAARDKKAIDVALLDLRPLASFTDFFVICSGSNPRQVQAIAEAVEERLRDEGLRPSHVEGFDRAEWILLDYFDFIVHVFSSARREFYALERLWGSAARVEV